MLFSGGNIPTIWGNSYLLSNSSELYLCWSGKKIVALNSLRSSTVRMSADIFMSRKESRIPVPSSPAPLRRAGSLRFPSAGALTPAPQFQRGNSFMERGERHNNGAPARPRNLRGPPSPQSPGRLRSLSMSLSSAKLQAPNTAASPKTPPTSPRGYSYPDWDVESISSLTSVTSVASCDHASVARNGTTFSGRSMKYVFHCNQHAGATGEDYLTPTQRVHRQVKKLKYLLHEAKKDLDDKDSDILKLTKEVVELRLFKAALNSPEERSNSSDAITVKDGLIEEEESTPEVQMTNSYTDSGHFEDFANSPIKPSKSDKAVSATLGFNSEHTNLILEYEHRLQELVKTHEEDSYQLKQKHNDKIEELLQRITDINKRYWELVPELDSAKDKIKELETQLEDACQKLHLQEEKQKETFVEMFNKGQEAARLDQENKEMNPGSSRISVPELLEELQVTKNELENIKDLEYASSSNSLQPLLSAKEALSLWVLGARKAMYRQLMEAKNRSKIDPEITLQFLKSAVYYFLTDKENSNGHLKAIQSILGFSPSEISNIDKARLA